MTIPPATMFGMRVVAIHNQVRGAEGVGPVMWDRSLAAAADAYAQQLAVTGRWGHSPNQARPGQGENLWMGTRGAFSVDQMVGAWASERCDVPPRRLSPRSAEPAIGKTSATTPR